MASKPLPTDLAFHSFRTAKDLEKFFADHHASLPGFYLKLAKKSSGITSVTADEAIKTALCYGWINGWGRSIDQNWYFSRYTPRRRKSIWSQRNVDFIQKLQDEGRMQPTGIAEVEAAKADGRWERAYAGPATIEVPDDFAEVLEADSTALAFFKGLDKTNRYSVLWRIQTTSPSNRPKRIRTLVQMLAEGRTIHAATTSSKSTRPKKTMPMKRTVDNPSRKTSGTRGGSAGPRRSARLAGPSKPA